MVEREENFEEMMGSQDREDRGGRRGGGSFKKKSCRFTADSELKIDYKNVRLLQNFLTEHGKIVPRRITGNSAWAQRDLGTAIKRARQLALIGYVSIGG